MPKRTAEEKINHYNKKIQRLQKQSKPRARQIILSDSEDEYYDVPEEANEAHIYEESVQYTPHDDPQPGPSSLRNETADPSLENPVSEPSAPVETAPADIDIDPELLAALGDSTADSPLYGPNIHESLATLWSPLLKKGMSKDNKDKVLEKYSIPDNCRLLQAPKLNIKMSPMVISDMIRNRDKKLMNFQQQLGCGATAVNRAMDILLKGGDKAEALKHLSDSCRILSDFHFMITQYRVKLITPSLEKSFLTIVQDSERDETLFGNTLGEKIRVSGTIQRQGLQIKKSFPNQKDKAIPSTSTGRSNQGNWSNAPRYHPPTNRGGRGAYRRPMTSVVRRPYHGPPPPPPPPPRMPFSNRPRAPFQ